MDSDDHLIQPDPLQTTRSASNTTMTQNAHLNSCTRPSSPNAGPSSTTLRESSVNKRRRSQAPPSDSNSDSNHYPHTYMPPRKKIMQLDDDATYALGRKKNKSSTPVHATTIASYAASVNGIITKSSKRQKTKAITSSNTASVSSSTSASRSKSIMMGKKRKFVEQFDYTPVPSSSTIYPTPRTPSLDLQAASPASSFHPEDDDSDQTLERTITSTEPELDRSKNHNERISKDVDNLNKLLRDACDKLSFIQQRLRQTENDKLAIEDSVQKTKAEWDKIRMDTMLERIRIQDECRKDLEAERLRRMKANASHDAEIRSLAEVHARDTNNLVAKHKVDLFEAHASAAASKAQAHMLQHKLNNSIMTVSSLEAEIHNGRYLLSAAEEDLQEMARVKAEQAEEAVVKGLPPAYGDLEDEENLAPWARHHDQGPLQVAVVKLTMRTMFNDTLQKIMVKANEQRQSPDDDIKKAAGCVLLRLLSAALSMICSRLKPLLDQPNFADRSTKLIIEFCWQIVAAFEIRPISVNVDEVSRIAIGMDWRHIDNTLGYALEVAFHDRYPRTSRAEDEGPLPFCCPQCARFACTGYCVRLNELQTLLEHIKALRHRLEVLSPKHKFLSRVWGWLGEAVEVDLVFAARAASDEEEGRSTVSN